MKQGAGVAQYARETLWLNSAMHSPTPAHFEQAAEMVREEDVAQTIICGPEPSDTSPGLKSSSTLGMIMSVCIR